MKTVKIYIVGKYDYSFKFSSWSYYLNYKEAVIKRNGSKYEDGSNDSALLHSLYCALQDLTEPCILKIYSKNRLYFDRPKVSKDKKVMSNIVKAVIRAGHIVEFFIDDLGQINVWEQVYGNPSKNKVETKVSTAVPDIENKETVNEVFETKTTIEPYDWRQMYQDEDFDGYNKWLGGSGGY